MYNFPILKTISRYLGIARRMQDVLLGQLFFAQESVGVMGVPGKDFKDNLKPQITF